MEINKVQSLIAVMVIGVLLAVSSLIVLVPVLGGYKIEPYLDILEKYVSIFSGTIGAIVGFFFGKGQKELGK